MMKTETKLWDAADYLQHDEDVVHYLNAAFEEGDPVLIAAALDDVARARGLPKLGLGDFEQDRSNFSPSRDGAPELGSVLKAMRALGLRLKVAL